MGIRSHAFFFGSTLVPTGQSLSIYPQLSPNGLSLSLPFFVPPTRLTLRPCTDTTGLRSLMTDGKTGLEVVMVQAHTNPNNVCVNVAANEQTFIIFPRFPTVSRCPGVSSKK